MLHIDNYMKRIKILTLTILLISSIFCLYGCDKKTDLSPYVTTLKKDIYYGKNDDIEVKAQYGFSADKNNGLYTLTFVLPDKEMSNSEYILTFNYKDTEYKGTFSFSPYFNNLALEFKINDFSEKEFSVNITSQGKSEQVLLKTLVPQNTCSYKEVLDELVKRQPSIVESYFGDENKAEIILRILVKDEKAYYYVGLKKDDKIKAFLMDGKTKNILAVREVF